MLLGSHSECIAVGEVDNVIGPERDRTWVEDHYGRCTCGKCNFWPIVMETIDTDGATTLADRYAAFLRTFAEFFPGKIPVDSSKHLDTYHALASVSECTPIRITRDVRAWSVSVSGKVTARKMLRWYKMNKRYDKALSHAVNIGYEPLALHTDEALSKLCEAVDLEYQPAMKEIHMSDSHILVGNRMRTSGALKIRYDSRWLAGASIWPALLRPVMNYNRRRVYGL